MASSTHAGPTLLAIETSATQGSIALLSCDQLHARELATQGRRHAQTLTLEIHELLNQATVTPGQLQGIAVGLGPGSFTGLRVGLVCAKTLAYALGCPVLGIETYQAIAAQVSEAGLLPEGIKSLSVIGDAQRGDLFLARFELTDSGNWQRQGEYQIVPGETWLQEQPADAVIAGPGVTRCRSLATQASLLDAPASVQPTASMIAQLARLRYEQSDVDDAWTISPIYLRPSAAEEQWDKRHASP